MSRERILVIDDSPTLLELVEVSLAKAGFASATPLGRSLAQALQEERPALVLLGTVADADAVAAFFAALRERKNEREREDESEGAGLGAIPVVLLGGPAPRNPAFADAARPREVVDVIDKPFSPEALLTVVEHALRARDPAAPRPTTDLGSLSLVPVDSIGDATIETEAWSAEAALALSGDLGIISLADVLGLLDAEAQTGILTVRRADAHLQVFFAAGRIELATAEGVPEEFLLGRFLIRGGAMAAPTLANALAARAAESSGGERPLLGKYLVDRGYVGQAALHRVLSL
jgi:CheY-like chemotaxis protein